MPDHASHIIGVSNDHRNATYRSRKWQLRRVAHLSAEGGLAVCSRQDCCFWRASGRQRGTEDPDPSIGADRRRTFAVLGKPNWGGCLMSQVRSFRFFKLAQWQTKGCMALVG